MKNIIVSIVFLLFVIFTIGQTHTGCVSGNCKDGKGTYVFQDGATYVGEFKNGIMEGFGKLTDRYGNVYTGFLKITSTMVWVNLSEPMVQNT